MLENVELCFTVTERCEKLMPQIEKDVVDGLNCGTSIRLFLSDFKGFKVFYDRWIAQIDESLLNGMKMMPTELLKTVILESFALYLKRIKKTH